ncbi:MAG: N-acetyltransferase [Dokdonella sp.]|uniref:GNAT family N-acetyltransferase n=1 Tax=Dokdonella sp. TaxID=2291710 RepID=UPI0025BEB048|nr:GNAT family N-acetyltransferase [Dokdonella sp.]MBX3699622.1 N-acetyltransferase [Dokdonella sp.]
MSTPRPPAATRRSPTRGRAFRARDGRLYRLRAIHPSDVPALQRAFQRLDPEQVRQRTFHRINELSLEAATRFATVDPAVGAAYVVLDEDGEIRGEARFFVDAVGSGAEFAVITDPTLAGHGLGRALMHRLVREARQRGVASLWGTVLAQNTQMLEFSRRLGATREASEDEPGVVRVRFDLSHRLRRR